jgi:hypothetical protein
LLFHRWSQSTLSILCWGEAQGIYFAQQETRCAGAVGGKIRFQISSSVAKLSAEKDKRAKNKLKYAAFTAIAETADLVLADKTLAAGERSARTQSSQERVRSDRFSSGAEKLLCERDLLLGQGDEEDARRRNSCAKSFTSGSTHQVFTRTATPPMPNIVVGTEKSTISSVITAKRGNWNRVPRRELRCFYQGLNFFLAWGRRGRQVFCKPRWPFA